jgi:phage gp46-like protein
MMRAMAYPYTDIDLGFDATIKRCDVQIAGGDLVLAASPASALILSIGCDARAEADDELPQASTLSGGDVYPARRGWAGDALDAAGRRAGSRLWLLDREKQTEGTRARAEAHVTEALSWLPDEFGIEPDIDVTWLRKAVLGIGVRVGDFSLSTTKNLGVA